MGSCRRLHVDLRRIWLRARLRCRKEVSRDSPVGRRAGEQQHDPGLPGPECARDAEVILRKASSNMDSKTTLIRSWMFVPSDRQRMIDKSLGLSVAAILMDIEDRVAPASKYTSRRQIAASL